MTDFINIIPLEVQKITLVLVLTFLIGLIEEERKHTVEHHYVFGGVRTFPFFGMIGYASALLGLSSPAILAVGFAAVAGMMLLTFHHKASLSQSPGITSESAGLLTFLLGALVYKEFFWVATTLVVAAAILLELKVMLEGLAVSISKTEVLTFTKFLLLAAVILPILPNTPVTVFHINPQRVWLIVCAVSGISYASYLLQKFIGGTGVIVSAILGGAYSSTATTIALSKSSVGQNKPRMFSGAILMASGVMYLRLALLIAILNGEMRVHLSPILAGLGILTLIFGFVFSRRADPKSIAVVQGPEAQNPLEIRSALMFAGLFVAMLIITPLTVEYLGDIGIYGLAIITGVSDVDPFILGLTQTAGESTTVLIASIGIVIASASNNLAKGGYALIFSEKSTGRLAAMLLFGLFLVGLTPLVWLLS